MKLSKIFEEKPERWGLRGDPYFWAYLKERAEKMELISPDELENWIKEEYRSLSGKALTGEYMDFAVVEAFAHGGMSSGGVDNTWWTEEGIPMLKSRLAALHDEGSGIAVNLYYHGKNGNARKFAEEMERSGIADAIRKEEGNLAYRYFIPLDDPETVLLIDRWRDQAAIDAHHESPMMQQLAALREKYDLHMSAERYRSADLPASDDRFLRK